MWAISVVFPSRSLYHLNSSTGDREICGEQRHDPDATEMVSIDGSLETKQRVGSHPSSRDRLRRAWKLTSTQKPERLARIPRGSNRFAYFYRMPPAVRPGRRSLHHPDADKNPAPCLFEQDVSLLILTGAPRALHLPAIRPRLPSLLTPLSVIYLLHAAPDDAACACRVFGAEKR